MRSTWASAWPSSRVAAARALARSAAALGAALALAAPAVAKVYLSQAEALAQAFPDAEKVEPETFVLDDGQARRIEEIARSKLESRLVRVWRATKGGELLGFALIDVHNVRTLPEAFLVVLGPDGALRSLRLLAFHEPPEYQPPERWYAQFGGKSSADPLRLGGDVHGIVGATLSAQATTQGVRRALAIHQVLLRKEP